MDRSHLQRGELKFGSPVKFKFVNGMIVGGCGRCGYLDCRCIGNRNYYAAPVVSDERLSNEMPDTDA